MDGESVLEMSAVRGRRARYSTAKTQRRWTGAIEQQISPCPLIVPVEVFIAHDCPWRVHMTFAADRIRLHRDHADIAAQGRRPLLAG